MTIYRSKTIRSLLILRILFSAWVYVPVLVVFYRSRGLELSDIIILKAIFSLFIVLFEVPTGYIADQVGRRHCLIWGSVAFLVSTPLNITGYNFYQFLFADLFLALAMALISGADVAMAYDTLVDLGMEEQYPRLERTLSSLMGWSEGIGAISGGALAAISVEYPFYCQMVLMAVALIFSLLIEEPKRHLRLSPKAALCDMFSIARHAYIENVPLRSIIAFSAVAGATSFLIVFYAQGYMAYIDIPIAWFGILWAGFHFTMALSSFLLSRLENYLSHLSIFTLIALLQGICFIAMGLLIGWYGVLFVFILYALRGLRVPLVRSEINKLIGSDIRATVLSLDTFAFRGIFVVLGLVIGLFSRAYTLPEGFLIAGAIITLLSWLTVRGLRKTATYPAK